jgi:hypothetical protein
VTLLSGQLRALACAFPHLHSLGARLSMLPEDELLLFPPHPMSLHGPVESGARQNSYWSPSDSCNRCTLCTCECLHMRVRPSRRCSSCPCCGI